eukprot:815372-Rhodomonas_salina.1
MQCDEPQFANCRSRFSTRVPEGSFDLRKSIPCDYGKVRKMAKCCRVPPIPVPGPGYPGTR